jgi:hypothetical protein
MLIDPTAPLILDFTAQLAPVLWGMVGLLLVLVGAIAASVDLEAAEIYLGHRALLITTAGVLVLTIAALAIVRPDVAARIGLVTSG